MSTKPKYLEKAQRDLAQAKYFVDQRYIKILKPQISDWFKKMKTLTEFSRIFQDYNKRYFTFSLTNLSLYYSAKERYNLNEITYIPMEEIVEVLDKPHYVLSNQGIEWKEAFGLTIYLNGKYIILVAQSNDVYQLWLNYFESIRFRNDGKSILTRTRTQYYSNSFKENIPMEIADLKPTEQVNQKHIIEQTDLDDKIEQNNYKDEDGDSLNNVNNHNEENKPYTICQDEQYAQSSQIKIEAANKEIIQVQEEQQTIQQQQQFKEDISHLQPPEFSEQQSDKESLENIIILQNGNNLESPRKKTSQIEKDNLILPKRLDERKKQPTSSKNVQISNASKMKKNITNIWANYDDEGNEVQKPLTLRANFVDQEKKEGMFLQIIDINQADDQEIEQPEFLIKFDEIDGQFE